MNLPPGDTLAETALGLERVLGAPARFWRGRDALYQAWRAGREA